MYNNKGEVQDTLVGLKTDPPTPPITLDTTKEHRITRVENKVGSACALLKGVLDTTGAKEFNRLPTQPGASPELLGQAQQAGLVKSDNIAPGGTNPTLKDWVPGDRGYIKGQGRGLPAGEWIIYLGSGKFWGFGPATGWTPVQTLPQWMETVKGFSGVAQETGKRWYPGVGLR